MVVFNEIYNFISFKEFFKIVIIMNPGIHKYNTIVIHKITSPYSRIFINGRMQTNKKSIGYDLEYLHYKYVVYPQVCMKYNKKLNM